MSGSLCLSEVLSFSTGIGDKYPRPLPRSSTNFEGGISVDVTLLVAYLHVFAGTPEWTMYFAATASVLAAVADWRARRTVLAPRPG